MDAREAGAFAGSVAMDLLELFEPELMADVRARMAEKAESEARPDEDG